MLLAVYNLVLHKLCVRKKKKSVTYVQLLKQISTTFIFMITNFTIPYSCAVSSLPLLLLPLLSHPLCLDLLVCSVYFSLSVGVRFGTSGISSSLLSFNPAALPEGIKRKAPGS